MSKPRDGSRNSEVNSASPSPSQGSGKVVRAAIGRRLRAMYDEVASEPVPDRFAELLQRLEQTEREKG